MALTVDHLIVCVEDLDEAGDDLASRGLTSVPGGRHSGHGTANRIVPLGDSYIELLTVEDPKEAESSVFGRWAGRHIEPPLGVDAVCLRTDDLDSVCDRLGLESVQMSRRRPDGVELTWRIAGLDRALTDSVPFFIEWRVAPENLPGRTAVDHGLAVEGVAVSMTGVVSTLDAWVGEADGLEIAAGPHHIRATIRTDGGVIEF